MAISLWAPGTIYIPGALVIPSSVQGAAATTIPNADFESGDTGWTKGTGWSILAEQPFSGTKAAKYVGPNAATLVNATKIDVAPGKAITAGCYIQHGASSPGQANAAVILEWYDSLSALISTSTGNVVSTGSAGVWKLSEVEGVAPPNAAKVAIGVTGYNNWAALYVDSFYWNYITGVTAGALAYEAIQAEAGTSGTSEPTWPTVVGGTVVDGTVTWEAVVADTVTWEASPLLLSGSVEPTWPTEVGGYVSDNNIAWEAIPLRIEDENCPHSKVVAIAASKVFAGDSDIVRFCATVNARDWTSVDDAGYLPTGLQQKGQVGVTAMGVYRGNLAVWSPSTFQVWQVDPDPAAMALVDAIEGIGSIYNQAVQPVADDLFFLAGLGVRTVAIAEGAQNLATGDVGVPIDTLVQADVGPTVEPIATYYPSAGQYWLAFRPVTIAGLLMAGQWILTTTLYPVEGLDSVDWAGEVRSVISQPTLTEEISMTATLLTGALGAEIETTEAGPDAAYMWADLETGSLGAELTITEAGPDSVQMTAALISGILSGYGLVAHENPPDGLDWSAEVRWVTII